MYREYYYHQLNLYDEGVSKIAKACLQKYSLQECQTLTFTLGNYEISLILTPQDSQSLLLDSVVQTQDLLSGQILRKVSRRVLLLPQHKRELQVKQKALKSLESVPC